MAQIRGNLFGGFTGKLGKTYGRYVHGVNLGAIMPTKRGDKKASAQQKDLMERFAMLGMLASGFLNAIRLGLKVVAKTMGPLVSEFDAFVRINKNTVHVEGGVAEVDYGSILLSKGSLPMVGFQAPNFDEPLRIEVHFTPNSETPGADADDDVYLVAYEPESKQALMTAPVKRSNASVVLKTPSTWSGMTVHVYGFAIGAGRENKGVISASAYIGSGNVG